VRFTECDQYDALGLAALVKRREITPAEIFDAMVETRNSKVNAIVIAAFDQARDTITAGLPDGPFAGVPYLIKDLHAPVAGMPLCHASRLWRSTMFDFDSQTVARLRAAGFVIAGRTNAPELGINVSTEPALWARRTIPGCSNIRPAARVAAPRRRSRRGCCRLRTPRIRWARFACRRAAAAWSG